MASQAWKSKRHRNADVLSCFLADERTSADNQAVSTSPPARRRRRKVFSFLAYNFTLSSQVQTERVRPGHRQANESSLPKNHLGHTGSCIMRAVKSVVVYPVGSYARISYPSRSTICKDHLPWVSLQLQVSQVDRAYPLSVHIVS